MNDHPDLKEVWDPVEEEFSDDQELLRDYLYDWMNDRQEKDLAEMVRCWSA